MKFMVLSKPRGSVEMTVNAEQARASLERIDAFLESGILERCYAIIGGGSVYVLSAESYVDLMRVIRQNKISRHSDVEVLFIEEAEPGNMV